MKIAVVGAGYVGLVTAAGFAEAKHEVIVFDTSAKRIGDLMDGKVPFYEPGLPALLDRNRDRLTFTTSHADTLQAGIVFVCVGTPTEDLGAADLAAVEDVIASYVGYPGLIVIKSTVPPGTAAGLARHFPDLRIASNPEFLAEGTAVDNCLHPSRVVIGGDAPELVALYRAGSLYVLGTTEAELVKYASNYLLAAKVSLVNELAQLASAIGADVTKVLEAVGQDPRIGSAFLRPGIGWGGSCFRKDVSALLYEGQKLDLSMPLARAILDVNDRQRAQAASFATALAKRAAGLDQPRIGVLGLAFKPGTDDLRDAPAVSIVHRLLADGNEVHVHDPVVQQSQWPKPFRPGAKIVFDETLQAILQSHVVLLATEWPLYGRCLDWTQARPGTHVLDGRNFLDRDEIEAAGLFYHGVGRPSTKGAFEKRGGEKP